MTSSYNEFKTLVEFLKTKYGITQQAIADEISANRTAFNKALSGERIGHCDKYVELINSKYANFLENADKKVPTKSISNLEAWDIGLKEIAEVKAELAEMKDLLKKALGI